MLYLYLAQECKAAVTLLLSEACLFVTRMEDSFGFHVAKRQARHPFRLCHEINNIENYRQPSFKLSSLFLADDWLGLVFSLKRKHILCHWLI